jgi:hypothetical protein
MRDRLAERAGGRPLFVEVLRMPIASQVGEQQNVTMAHGSLPGGKSKTDRVGTQVSQQR